MRAFLRRLTKQNAIVGNNAHWITKDAGKTADQSGAIERLKFIKIRTIHNARNHLPHIIGFARIRRHHTIDFAVVIGRLNRLFYITIERLNSIESSHSLAG